MYVHTNLFNGKRYIGITSQVPDKRWKNGSGYIGCTYFYNAIQKYGWEAFSHKILYTGLSESDAKAKEVELIRKYNTTNDNYGYNLTNGGDGASGRVVSAETREKISKSHQGLKHSEEAKKVISDRLRGNCRALGHKHSEKTKEKISNASKGNQYSKGYHHTEEMKQHLSEAHRGKTLSLETRQKLSAINKGRKLSDEAKKKISIANRGKKYFEGHRHTDESKAKMSKAQKDNFALNPERARQIASRVSVAVDMYTLDNQYIQTFTSAVDAKRLLGIDNSSIIKACKGKIKTAGGYLWKYSNTN